MSTASFRICKLQSRSWGHPVTKNALNNKADTPLKSWFEQVQKPPPTSARTKITAWTVRTFIQTYRTQSNIRIIRLSNSSPEQVVRIHKRLWPILKQCFRHLKLNGNLHWATDLLHYPASRLGRMSGLKLLAQFTHEAVVLSLVVLLCSLTALQTPSGTDPAPSNAKYSTVTLAYAATSPDDNNPQPTSSTPTDNQQTTEAITVPTGLTASGLIAPQITNIPKLIESQLTIYETSSGDTLSDIAKRFGVTSETIKASNKLKSDRIREGWSLIIPPSDGVLVRTENGTTVSAIAKKYGCSQDEILSYNGLTATSTLHVGQYLLCPGGKIKDVPPAASATAAAVTTPRPAAEESDEKAGTVVNTFVPGHCTWYVAKRMPIRFSGNANQWLKNAKRAGYETGHVPMAGSAVVTSTGGPYGHVAFVESVNSTAGTITISEMNYEGLGVKNSRTLPSSSVVGFIYPLEE